MRTRIVSVLIGPNISPYVKLWGSFITIIEQTGASRTWVFASSGALHDDTSFRVVEVCLTRPFHEMEQ